MHYYFMGITLGLSLIITLGPQNLFLIQQGIKRDHAWLAASICFLCDMILVTASVLGLNELINRFPTLKTVMLYGGVIFLIGYGSLSLFNSVKSKKGFTNANTTISRPLKIILITLSFSVLNPHAIIDTLLMIGGSASQLSRANQYPFLLGVLTSSFLWFFSVTFTATKFSNLLSRKEIFTTLQVISGLIMLTIAMKLMLS